MKCLVVDTQKLKNNISVIKTRAGGAHIYAVLKGDAYGLGIAEMARILRDEGISRFAVTEVKEAKLLRDKGFLNEEILMLRSTTDHDELEALIDLNVVCTVGSNEAGVMLNGIAKERSTVVEAHIKIDTGMGRYGFLPSETDKIISIFRYMQGIAVTGMYTHFHSAFKSRKTAGAQLDAFNETIRRIREAGFETGAVHIANSPAFFKYDDLNMDAVRIGSAFLGRIPVKGRTGLMKIGHIETRIDEMKWLPKGHFVGYGAAYKTKKPTKTAVIPVGYADGYCMEKARDSFRFSDCVIYALSILKKFLTRYRLHVTINGAKARVIGHVGMECTVVDVSGIDCAVGDTVIMDANPIYVKSMPVKYI